MTDIQAAILSVVAIGIALAWTPLVALIKAAMPQAGPLSPVPATPAAKVSFPAALAALSVVRNRLVDTGCLDEPAKSAIENVTHALIAGTDK